MITLGIWLAERGMLPDFILRVAVKFLSKARVRMPNVFSEKLKVLNTLKEGPIAESTSSANEQHYEVPPIFFEKVLGENLKYSCCLYDEDNKDLNSAEIFMLDKYLDRADIKSNQEILDLGCGWGSFTLHAAKKFPQSNFTSISNSKDQIDFINARATALNLTNVKAIRQNIMQRYKAKLPWVCRCAYHDYSTWVKQFLQIINVLHDKTTNASTAVGRSLDIIIGFTSMAMISGSLNPQVAIASNILRSKSKLPSGCPLNALSKILDSSSETI